VVEALKWGMELLSDPTNDRKVKAVKPPPHRPLSKELMWGKSKQCSRELFVYLLLELSLRIKSIAKLQQPNSKHAKNKQLLLGFSDLWLFNLSDGKPDWKVIRDHLHKEGRISKENLIQLIDECNRILSKQKIPKNISNYSDN